MYATFQNPAQRAALEINFENSASNPLSASFLPTEPIKSLLFLSASVILVHLCLLHTNENVQMTYLSASRCYL